MWFERVKQVLGINAQEVKRGTVKFFNRKRGYGFIESESLEQDVFVHVTDLEDRISKGDQVQFEIEDSPKGYEARNVRLVEG